MEVLKLIFCAASLIGIHFTTPCLALLLDIETKYDTLIKSFPVIYKDLTETKIECLLQTENKVVNFVSDETFSAALPMKCLKESVNNCADIYKKEISQLLSVILPRLAEGFSDQRGAMFGFGPKADDDTGTLLKVSNVGGEKRQKLNKVAVHNLNEERSVGFVNYEVHIRGKHCLEAAYRKVIINKSMDLLESAEPGDINKYC